MRRSSPVFVLFLAATLSRQAGAQSGAEALQNVAPEPTAPSTPLETPPLPLTTDALQGPPNPATMYALTSLSDGQLGQYLAAYRAHMAATWSIRVSTMSALSMMDRAFKNSDADRVRYYQLVLDQLWGRLRNQDQGFDTAVGSILNRKQLERFRTWIAAWERGAWAQQRFQVSLIESTALVR